MVSMNEKTQTPTLEEFIAYWESMYPILPQDGETDLPEEKDARQHVRNCLAYSYDVLSENNPWFLERREYIDRLIAHLVIGIKSVPPTMHAMCVAMAMMRFPKEKVNEFLELGKWMEKYVSENRDVLVKNHREMLEDIENNFFNS